MVIDKTDKDRDEARRVQTEMSDRLEDERRNFRSREREIEQQAYTKAKQEFELENRKKELERKQKDIEDRLKLEKELQQKQEQEKQTAKKRLSVGQDINPITIQPSPTQKKPGMCFESYPQCA